MAQLILSDGTVFAGESFGADADCDGEVVFNTGMAGYVESLTDPSYRGQILVFTYPLIGNYGVPSSVKNAWGFSNNFESEKVQVRGVIVSQVSGSYCHHTAVSSLQNWLVHHGIPGITGVDTRALTKKLREHGVMLGRMTRDTKVLKAGEAVKAGEALEALKALKAVENLEDPNCTNLVAEVSCTEPVTYVPERAAESGSPKAIVCYDCGIKNNILRSWLRRGVTVHRVPWDFDLSRCTLPYDAVCISNGPGDPKMCDKTIAQIAYAIGHDIPTFGICLGIQLMALAIGGDTYKLKYGHRGVNQPCIEEETEDSADLEELQGKMGGRRCIITSQNHGFAVSENLPAGWRVWFRNANDGSIEGIRHASGRFFAVQFHPEATPGPEDAGYLFDEFLKILEPKIALAAAV